MSSTSKTKRSLTTFEDWSARQNFDEDRIAKGVRELYREILEYKLKELRKKQGLTQQQLADKLGITQNRISKLEKLDLDRAELQTIRSYINALGGELSLVVEIDGNQHKIQIKDES